MYSDRPASNALPAVLPNRIDVSIVLNAHREAAFLPRTLDSLDEAVRYAQAYGITCELVVVEDRSDEATRDIFRRRDYSPYVAHKIIEVDNGSLGLSRNDGIAASSGEFVASSDADDLISVNYIAECVHAATSFSGNALFFTNYIVAFGATSYICEYHSLDVATPQALVGYHPFVSRFFARRAAIAGFTFADLFLSSGFAFEDWHFNLQVVGAGFDMRVVPNTILYYRQRQGSLLQLANGLSNRQTAYAPFFDPETYLRRCGPWTDAAREKIPEEFIRPDLIRDRFVANPVCRELTKAAAHIEPAIDPVALPTLHAFANVQPERRVGVAYESICRLIAGETFDDILLVPFLSAGGGEKYVLHVLFSLMEQKPDTRLLIISGEAFDLAHAWLDRLPPNALFLDLQALSRDLDEHQRHILTMRTIQACGRHARIHIKPCRYALEFIRKFAPVLHDNAVVMYRFCDEHELFFGSWIRRGQGFDFISDCGKFLDKIITDNDGIRNADVARLPHLDHKYATLYNYVEADIRAPVNVGPVKRRVLWASRMDSQKRPELLPLIAAELSRRAPDVTLDVYGAVVLDRFDMSSLVGLGNLNYCGPFQSFAALCPERYDLFLYTSAFDGLPNVVLEAMAAGLVVIATDVGGVSEAVPPGAGILIDAALSDEDMARAYAEAVADCYNELGRIGELRTNALDVIAANHRKAHFDAQVAKLFGVARKADDCLPGAEAIQAI